MSISAVSPKWIDSEIKSIGEKPFNFQTKQSIPQATTSPTKTDSETQTLEGSWLRNSLNIAPMQSGLADNQASFFLKDEPILLADNSKTGKGHYWTDKRKHMIKHGAKLGATDGAVLGAIGGAIKGAEVCSVIAPGTGTVTCAIIGASIGATVMTPTGAGLGAAAGTVAPEDWDNQNTTPEPPKLEKSHNHQFYSSSYNYSERPHYKLKVKNGDHHQSEKVKQASSEKSWWEDKPAKFYDGLPIEPVRHKQHKQHQQSQQYRPPKQAQGRDCSIYPHGVCPPSL